ncbi:MAG: hypothetical protein Q7R81_04425 [Candidatus Peregrinibacteria bacterium]|nr:hypothetical protein [Candidatus Peregrinibacteria bacterium]
MPARAPEHDPVSPPPQRLPSTDSTIVFWIAFGLACAWLLPRYYSTRGAKRVQELRRAAIVMDSLVLLSLALPWIPASRGGPLSGLTIIASGNILLIAFALSVVCALTLFSINTRQTLWKIGACLQILATFLLFAAMLRLLPGTFALKIGESAPIAAALLLLAGNVAALFLWHQLQKRRHGVV